MIDVFEDYLCFYFVMLCIIVISINFFKCIFHLLILSSNCKEVFLRCSHPQNKVYLVSIFLENQSFSESYKINYQQDNHHCGMSIHASFVP